MSQQPTIDEIFCHAIEIASEDERRAYLDEVCAERPEIRRQLERLLEAHFRGGSFLDHPIHAIGSTVALPPEKVGTQIGPYKLLQEIGQGGMGVVYMAEQLEPVRRKVALKIIKPGMDSRQVISRFEAERQALAMMEHPNIARVLDAGTTDSGLPYFVMELVKGEPITQYCDQRQLTPRQRLELLLPVCQAIQHAHQKGVIHRDIKPSNVLVAEYDHQPVPKVIDFGLAKATSQLLTEKTMFTGYGQILGTLEYMSPEQAKVNQLDVDTRSDIYALGVLMYELLTGSTPFDKKRLREAAWDEMLRILREEEPPKPSTRLSESKELLLSISAQRHTEPAKLTKLIQGELDWIVMKAMEKDRSRRYETTAALARDVERYLHNEAVEACPPGWAYRTRKFAAKHRSGLLVASVIAATLLFSTAISTQQYFQARRAADVAAISRAEAVEMQSIAEASEAEAARQLDVTQTILNFFEQDLLALAIPTPGLGPLPAANPNITLRAAIDRAAARVEDRFAENPTAELHVRLALGEAYNSLGLYEVGEGHLQRARQLTRDIYNPGSDTIARLTMSLAIAQLSQGEIRDATSLVRQTLADQQVVLNEPGRKQLEELAVMLAALSPDNSANPQPSSVAATLERVAAATADPDTQKILRDSFGPLASWIDEMKRDEQVMPAVPDKLFEVIDTGNPGMSEVFRSWLAASNGDFDTAADYATRGYATLESNYGSDHPYVGSAAFVKGYIALMQLQPAEAEKELRSAIRIRELTKSSFVERQVCQVFLARALTQQKRFSEAETILVEQLNSSTPPAPGSLPPLSGPSNLDHLADPVAAMADWAAAQDKHDLATQWRSARRSLSGTK